MNLRKAHFRKNPLIASFFHEIGNADELGSGTRNLFKYTSLYSGAEPVLREGDIFLISIPLQPAFSTENEKNVQSVETVNETVKASETVNETVNETVKSFMSEEAAQIYLEIKNDPGGTYAELSENTGFSRAKIARLVKELKAKGVIERVGSDKQGAWKINKFFGDM